MLQIRARTTAAVLVSMLAAGSLTTGGLHTAPIAEPTSKQINAVPRPAAISLAVGPSSTELVSFDLITPQLITSQATPTRPNTAAKLSAAPSAASWARRGPT